MVDEGGEAPKPSQTTGTEPKRDPMLPPTPKVSERFFIPKSSSGNK